MRKSRRLIQPNTIEPAEQGSHDRLFTWHALQRIQTAYSDAKRPRPEVAPHVHAI